MRHAPARAFLLSCFLAFPRPETRAKSQNLDLNGRNYPSNWEKLSLKQHGRIFTFLPIISKTKNSRKERLPTPLPA